MSKAKQRRVSAYSMGRRDALTGYGFRWAQHPQINDYREGYLSAKPQRPKYPAWLTWLLRFFAN